VLRKNSTVSSTKVRITEDSRHFSRRALSRCADRHRTKELFEFCNLKKNPEKDLHKVTEHPADSARGCLSEGVPGGHHISPSEGEEKG
jgi:hypothetical protein